MDVVKSEFGHVFSFLLLLKSDRAEPASTKINFCFSAVNENGLKIGISHSASWRGIRKALRGRFYREIRLGRGKSLEERIFGVVFKGIFGGSNSRRQRYPLALWDGLEESLYLSRVLGDGLSPPFEPGSGAVHDG